MHTLTLAYRIEFLNQSATSLRESASSFLSQEVTRSRHGILPLGEAFSAQAFPHVHMRNLFVVRHSKQGSEHPILVYLG